MSEAGGDAGTPPGYAHRACREGVEPAARRQADEEAAAASAVVARIEGGGLPIRWRSGRRSARRSVLARWLHADRAPRCVGEVGLAHWRALLGADRSVRLVRVSRGSQEVDRHQRIFAEAFKYLCEGGVMRSVSVGDGSHFCHF